MKPTLLLFPAIVAIACLLAFRLSGTGDATAGATAIREFKKRNIVSCSPDLSTISELVEGSDIPPMPGAGKHHWQIDTNNDSAQFYFDQGINMYYGFHIIEAIASFEKAARFDPTSAMLQWARALALGPNINDNVYNANPDAVNLSSKAVELSGKSPPRDKMLITAQAARYSLDSTISRKELNQRYADRMKEVYTRFPDDADVAALYADALMLQHPWDLWTPSGTPRPWTPEIREVLEKLLAKNPAHPGANHYYIHVMEPSPYAGKALPSANRLGDLSPGLSHLVHMPSHIYLRVGEFRKAVESNEKAVASYRNYMTLYAPVAANDFLYIIHNLHMQTNNAMMEGNEALSVKSGAATVESIPADYYNSPAPLGNYIQYISMTPLFVHVRFGNWAELISMKQPAQSLIYSNVLYHFGRGMAFAQQGKIREAKPELEQLRALMKDSSLYLPFTPYSAAIDGARVAEGILSGSISLAENRFDEAITAFSRAVDTEENMVYNEPRDWFINPRHYLGNAYLKSGQREKARKVFQADLKINNENGWALFGIYQAFMDNNRKSEAQKYFDRYRKAFGKADTELHAAVF